MESRLGRRPQLETLEDRVVPISSVTNIAGGVTPDQLARTIAGNGVVVSNVSFTGAQIQAGTFTGGTNSIGIESGIVLSTGQANAVVGTVGGMISTAVGTPGDADLNTLTNATSSDATNLTFTVIPRARTMNFTYVFASDEYTSFIFNPDTFAAFVNGRNVALLPMSNTLIRTTTINQTNNSQFFIRNTGVFPTTMGGFTTVLTVQVSVTPFVPNTIKFVIADQGTNNLSDSNVFLGAGSLAAGANPIAFAPFRMSYNPTTNTYDGVVTVLNFSGTTLTGPVSVAFNNLPPGVRLVNANATRVNSSTPLITVTPSNLGPGQVLRLLVKFSNPNRVPFNTFFTGANLEVLGNALT